MGGKGVVEGMPANMFVKFSHFRYFAIYRQMSLEDLKLKNAHILRVNFIVEGDALFDPYYGYNLFS